MNKLYGSVSDAVPDGAADAANYALVSAGVYGASLVPTTGLHDIYDASAVSCVCFANASVTDATALARIKAHILALNGAAGRYEAGESVIALICLYRHDGATGLTLTAAQGGSWLTSNLPGWNSSASANYLKSAVICCTAWSGSPAERYLGALEGTVAPPFHYVVSRKASGDYRVVDKFHCGSARNGSAADAEATDTLLLDFAKPISADDTASYLLRRVADALDAAPRAKAVPDTLWTRDAAEGAADPVARVTNDSAIELAFSEKAVGPADPANYVVSGAPAGLTLSPAGLSPDADSSEGLVASGYVSGGDDADSKDRWRLTLGGLTADDDGTEFSLSPSSLLDGSGNPFSIDPGNSSPLRFVVDTAGAIAEAPDWEVTLVENPGTPEESAAGLDASDGTDATVKAFRSPAWAIGARLLTRFPGTTLPTGRLETVELSFGDGLAAAPVAGPSTAGLYTLCLDAYTTGAGFAVPAREYKVRLDLTPPAVTDVTSPDADGVYGIGDDIAVEVAFGEPVVVSGTPRLRLELGTAPDDPVYADYDSGSGSDTLTFRYSVAAGHHSADLDYTGMTALEPNGGSIKDAAGNDMDATLPAPGAEHSLGYNKDIVIDGVVPSVIDVTSPDANGTYGEGALISVAVAFSEPVVVTGSPRLRLELGTAPGEPVYADYDSGSGNDTLTFRYRVAAGHHSADLDYTGTTALEPNGGSIKDAAGNDADATLPAPGAEHSLGYNKDIVIDGVVVQPEAPTVVNVGSTKPNGSYRAGVSIPVTVEFSAPVTVTGSPSLALNAGPDAAASLVAGQSYPRTTVAFDYVVAAGHESADLDYTGTAALAPNGSIKGDGDVDAVLTLVAPGAAGSLGYNKDIVVDTRKPVIVAVCYEKSVSSSGRIRILLKLTFSERAYARTSLLPWLRPGTTLSPRGAPDIRFDYLRGSGGWTLEFGSTLPAGTAWPPAPAPAGLRITLEVVSGYVRDKAGNDAVLRFSADLACTCPESPHCLRPIACKLPESCALGIAPCKLPEFCKTPVFCRLPEACAFPEACAMPVACRLPIACKIPEYCKSPLTGGCGLPVNCSGLIGVCKALVDPVPYDPSEIGYPPILEDILVEAERLAATGGKAALDAFTASKGYAERLGRLDPATRRAAAAQLAAIREELG